MPVNTRYHRSPVRFAQNAAKGSEGKENARECGKSGKYFGKSKAGFSIGVLDATDIEEPGPTGTDWRLHYSLRLPQLSCDFLQLTDVHGGETLKRLPVAKGDIVLCDRGYSHRQGVAQVLDQEADVVVWLNSVSFPLEDGQGESLDLLNLVEKLKVGQVGEWPVWFENEGQRHPLRLCVLRKSEMAAARAKARRRRKRARRVTRSDQRH